MDKRKPEVWQRGPIESIPDLLQPVAHALLQANEEVKQYTEYFQENVLWKKPAGAASVGFHLNHMTGVVDRMLTYAYNKKLSEKQLKFLKAEENSENSHFSVAELINNFNAKVKEALIFLGQTSTEDLTEFRGIGRAQLPSTKLGLLFHAAEHVQRHVGQLLVTVKVLTKA
jgi:uncharacterized damage-inducible protein DinB